MAKFRDLPLEIILDIIERALGTSKTRRVLFFQMSSFSLVCKDLNRIMAPKLFRTYRLQLRESHRTDIDRRCFLTDASLLMWNEDAFDARLEHLRKKAVLVRELRIVDHGQPGTIFGKDSESDSDDDEEGGVENKLELAPFDPTLVPVLLETLNTLDGLVSVVFEGTDTYLPATRLPEQLWHWLARIKPEKVSFDGYFAFPPSLERLPSVRFMSFLMSDEASRVLEFVRPAHVDMRVNTVDRLSDNFKEIFEPYPSLEQLDVRFRHYDDSLPPGYFDFTSHPEMRIGIHLIVRDIEAYIEAPEAWVMTEEHLKSIFVEDFTKLDVRREDGSDTIVVSRPQPGQSGGVRDLHIPERDEDKDAVLVFEQAVLASMGAQSHSHHGLRLLDGPVTVDDTAFWADLDNLFETVYSQTFENLVRA